MKKTVVLGVTGSIAAYKSAEIVSRFRKLDVDVRVILTASGSKFITPLTLETLSRAPVITDMWSRETPWEVEHISLAKAADVFLVAPASANFLAKAAYGIADDMLTTTLLATRARIAVAPAMNALMYSNSVVRENISKLKGRGVVFIEPGEGILACGDTGSGRLAEPSLIVEKVMELLHPKLDLKGKNIIVSAGPTREHLDPVRFLSNRSTGKMGFAIAEAAAERGATVTLISGKTELETPFGTERVDVVSTREMYDAIDKRFSKCDALIMAAAPSDFTPVRVFENKIKKQANEDMKIEFKPTVDILKSVGQKKNDQIMIGFAAETENIEAYAREKLVNKNLDIIAANDISAEGTGFETDTNSVTLYFKDGSVKSSGLRSKREVADFILNFLV
ncbi:MAG: Coenzyme A biosynthesis bifunctional protein CoaBC [Firmicutes bacterium ADurb.Bin182]|nr:MAG: Coenzyme A biosynthesis bifunctional protein CoaBC [Firmicutes bacterium ADurb.Bin182]